jgi:hypothetical protein
VWLPSDRRQPLSVVELLKSIGAQISMVNVSTGATFWTWEDESGNPIRPPQPRYNGKCTSWASKEEGKEQIRIKFEKGLDKDGKPQEGYAPTAVFNLSDLLKPQHGFHLEKFDDGRPPLGSQALAEEAQPRPVATALLLGSTDFSDMQVLLARADAVVAPAVNYFKTVCCSPRAQPVRLGGTKCGQLGRLHLL